MAPRDFVLGQHFRVSPEHDVRSPAGHVGRNGDGFPSPGLGDDGGLHLVVLGVQDLMGNFFLFEQLGKFFGIFDGNRANENGLAASVTIFDLFDNRLNLLPLRPVDHIGEVLADHWLIGGNDDDFQFIDLLEFRGLRVCSSRHASKFFKHPEVVLECDGGQRLILFRDLHSFLGLNGLVQPVTPATARHHASGEFVNNHDLPVLDHIIDVLLEKPIGLNQLMNGMNPFGGLAVPELEGLTRFDFLLQGQGFVTVDGQVSFFQGGNHESVGPALGEEIQPFFGQFDGVGAFIDGAEKTSIELG